MTSAQRAAAGKKTLAVALRVRRSDTGGALATGEVRCFARVTGRSLPVFDKGFRRGAATCIWRVSRRAAGKTVSGAVTVGYRGAAVTREFRLRLR